MGFFSGITSILKPIDGDLIGGLVSGGMSYLGGQATNRANQDISSAQMAYQTMMSNTSYQRAVEDMKAAGLNPMLAYTQGGASTPTGASIPSVNSIQEGLNSALQLNRAKAELDNLRVSNEKIKSDVSLNRALEVAARSDALLKSNSAKVAGVNAALMQSSLPAARNEEAFHKDVGKNYPWIYRSLQIMKDILGTGVNAKSLF